MSTGSAVTLLLLAFTLAGQPWSILAGILLITSRRGVLKESLYTLGWMAALSVVFALAVAFAPPSSTSSSSQPQWPHVVEILLGVLFIVVLLVRWRRPPAIEDVKTPKWMSKIDSMSVGLAFVLGGFLPNYIVVVAAANELLQLHVSQGALALWGVVFVLVASIGVAAPLGVLLVRRQKAPQIYENWRLWLISHSRAVSFGTGGLIALLLVAKGLVGLIG